MSIYTSSPPGLNSAGPYQVAARPFLKGGLIATNTIKVLEFPSVTSWVHFNNKSETTAGEFFVAFSENGFTTGNSFAVGSIIFNYVPDEAFPIKVTRIYYKGNNIPFDVVAGLTSISANNIDDNWSGSLGVG